MNPFKCTVDNITYNGTSILEHSELNAVLNYEGNCRTLITNAEPCPMCMSAIIWSGKFDTVIYGIDIPTLINYGWKQSNIRASVIIKSFDSNIELLQDISLCNLEDFKID